MSESELKVEIPYQKQLDLGEICIKLSDDIDDKQFREALDELMADLARNEDESDFIYLTTVGSKAAMHSIISALKKQEEDFGS